MIYPTIWNPFLADIDIVVWEFHQIFNTILLIFIAWRSYQNRKSPTSENTNDQ